MIPGTLLGALFLAACLVPGFIYLRVAEQHRARLSRSTLLEAVELAGIGAATSLVACTLVLMLTRWWGVVDAGALADDPGRYLLFHPVRVLGPTLAAFGLSWAIAWVVAQLMFAKSEPMVDPAATVWGRTFWDSRPSEQHVVVATVELKDRRRVAGQLSGFSIELEDSRELALARPIAASLPGQPLVEVEDDFVILREEQIASIAGNYVLPGAAQPLRPVAQSVAHPVDAPRSGA